MAKVRALKDEKARNQEDIEMYRHNQMQKALHNTRAVKEQREMRREKLAAREADRLQK